MLRYKTETRPGLIALYDIRPGNGAGQFLQPWSPHGATVHRAKKICDLHPQADESTVRTSLEWMDATPPEIAASSSKAKWGIYKSNYILQSLHSKQKRR